MAVLGHLAEAAAVTAAAEDVGPVGPEPEDEGEREAHAVGGDVVGECRPEAQQVVRDPQARHGDDRAEACHESKEQELVARVVAAVAASVPAALGATAQPVLDRSRADQRWAVSVALQSTDLPAGWNVWTEPETTLAVST